MRMNQLHIVPKGVRGHEHLGTGLAELRAGGWRKGGVAGLICQSSAYSCPLDLHVKKEKTKKQNKNKNKNKGGKGKKSVSA